mmetsp:Transcript_2451/g.5987  ORF Transcript_2451/g.5987 Transcript_2451/m.5987 type:complete len:100 (-) Transcript_2451:48-347(-)
MAQNPAEGPAGGIFASILFPFGAWLSNLISSVKKHTGELRKEFKADLESMGKAVSDAVARIDSVAARLTDRADSIATRTDSLAGRMEGRISSEQGDAPL